MKKYIKSAETLSLDDYELSVLDILYDDICNNNCTYGKRYRGIELTPADIWCEGNKIIYRGKNREYYDVTKSKQNLYDIIVNVFGVKPSEFRKTYDCYINNEV